VDGFHDFVLMVIKFSAEVFTSSPSVEDRAAAVQPGVPSPHLADAAAHNAAHDHEDWVHN
jgi:hypothetical protein